LTDIGHINRYGHLIWVAHIDAELPTEMGGTA